MPTCRRKRVILTEPSDVLLAALKSDPNKQVYYLEQTGEIFDSYDAYAARMSFYRLKQFQCEVTGKSGLDYFQALESERQEAKTMHSRFSEPLKPPILKAVQWQVMGRLDHLVEAVYERFKDRYFQDEKVIVELEGIRYQANIERVLSSKSDGDNHGRTNGSYCPEIHAIGGNLEIKVEDALAHDDPAKYSYRVAIMDLEKDKAHDKAKTTGKNAEKLRQMMLTTHDVRCNELSRDRLSFSKSILRRFIRDCVDRDAAVASPWTVKPSIAKRYGVDSDMPEEKRKSVENIKKGEIDKRKKIWEDKEGPPTKKQKKLTAAQEERVEKKERDAREKAEKQRLAREEAERLASEKKKKKPIRYPTEDLDIQITERDKKAGIKLKRPIPSRAIPFNDTPGVFEQFLMTWNFLVVYGQPLHLSTFTLDELEHALRHSMMEPSCGLLAEIHSTLIYNLRTVPFQRHNALLSLLRLRDEMTGGDNELHGVTIEQLTAAMADIGNNWERVPLRAAQGREGWEEALLGCLKDHATVATFPRLRGVLTRLLFAPEPPTEPVASSSSSPESTPVVSNLTTPSTPTERYYTLPPADRIAILSFMCDLAISSKAIHAHMEGCEEQLTALRKEKIEVNRMKKQYTEEMNTLAEETQENALAIDEDVVMHDSSELSDVSQSESSETNGRSKKRQKELRQKVTTQAHAKQREAARAKQAAIKHAAAERRRLEEAMERLDKKLESIERDFRKLLGGVRVKPLGKDRFYNRIWWFDGMGSTSLVGSGGVAQYGAGRLFIQGPSEFDTDLLQKRKADGIDARREDEEGIEGVMHSGDWAVYTTLEELEEFLAWLNSKGHRELALKTTLTKWWNHIISGARKRQSDLNASAKIPEARRSARTKAIAGYDIAREPYMLWTNRRAVNSS